MSGEGTKTTMKNYTSPNNANVSNSVETTSFLDKTPSYLILNYHIAIY